MERVKLYVAVSTEYGFAICFDNIGPDKQMVREEIWRFGRKCGGLLWRFFGQSRPH